MSPGSYEELDSYNKKKEVDEFLSDTSFWIKIYASIWLYYIRFKKWLGY